MNPEKLDELDTTDSEAAAFREQQQEWNDRLTAADFLEVVLRQQHDLEAARRAWEQAFLSDQRRIEEWKL